MQSNTQYHCSNVIMITMASQITSFRVVYATVYQSADQRKYQSSASLACVRGIHRSPVNSSYKGPVTRQISPFDDVIMSQNDISRTDQEYGNKFDIWFADVKVINHLAVCVSWQLHRQKQYCQCSWHISVYFILYISHVLLRNLTSFSKEKHCYFYNGSFTFHIPWNLGISM